MGNSSFGFILGSYNVTPKKLQWRLQAFEERRDRRPQWVDA